MSAMTASPPTRAWALAAAVLRWSVGGVFIYLGLTKALHPVEFLKLVRQYEVVSQPPLLNLIASALPWFEVICGLLLVLGTAVRGTTLVMMVLMIAFTGLVVRRALALAAAGGIAFCDLRMDCGCGSGEVWVCGKVVENALLLVALGIILSAPTAFGLRPALFRGPRVAESRVERRDAKAAF
ncbi:MAG TPA: MauE/DoxX family redox-associated membrane protein [Methylomirabilota bacterium]|nr:MauE/DoxX family redox-associated membrane protein [Methylomirabilota bacterium]